MNRLQKLIPKLEDRQALSLFLDRLHRLLAVGHRLADVELLPLRKLVGGLPQASKCLSDCSLTRLGLRVLPWPAHILRNRIQQTLLHRFPRFAPLCGQSLSRRCCTGQTSIWLFHHLDRRKTHAGFRGLSAQEHGLLLLQLDFEIFFDVTVGEESLLLVTVEPLVLLDHTRGLQLLSLPHLVFVQLLFLSKLLPLGIVVRKVQPNAGDLAKLGFVLLLPLSHGV
mmetsp:Transcript_113875/g.271130  ORF Transcript_113875/g.271130 Transcript_113875/m.271130 type:complete len:224 (+) Transcript_113875:466-1137(+)